MLKSLHASRAMIAVAAMAFFAEAAYALLNNFAFPFLAKELDLVASMGIIGGTFLLVEALMKGPCGTLADRYGHRSFVILAPACATAIATVVWVASGMH